MPIDISCTTEQQIRFTASPTTTAGRPAALDGNLEVIVDSGDATVEPGAGALDVVVQPGALLGDIIGRIRGDADLGEGVVTIEDTFVIHVTSAQAENLGLSAVVEPA